MTERANVRMDLKDGAATVTATGELDLNISAELDARFSEAKAVTNDITLDLREASFIDSAILASMVRIGRILQREGARLEVAVLPGSHPAYVLRTVGFGVLMDIIEEPAS